MRADGLELWEGVRSLRLHDNMGKITDGGIWAAGRTISNSNTVLKVESLECVLTGSHDSPVWAPPPGLHVEVMACATRCVCVLARARLSAAPCHATHGSEGRC